VSNALLDVDGVHEATADRKADRVTVGFSPERVDEDALRRVIEEVGFEAVA